MRLERRARVPVTLALAAPFGAVLVALLLAGILIAMTGAPVLEAYQRILISAFGSKLSITETLTRATPLILTGLAVAVAFRTRLWNIGGEGQFYSGALVAATLGSQHGLQLPGAALIPTLMVAGAVAGATLMLVPLGLRLRFGVDEVVTTLLRPVEDCIRESRGAGSLEEIREVGKKLRQAAAKAKSRKAAT